MSGCIAILDDGREVELDPDLGDDPEHIIERLTTESLTGSAVPLADAELPLADGGTVRYYDVREIRPSKS